MMSTTNKH